MLKDELIGQICSLKVLNKTYTSETKELLSKKRRNDLRKILSKLKRERNEKAKRSIFKMVSLVQPRI